MEILGWLLLAPTSITLIWLLVSQNRNKDTNQSDVVADYRNRITLIEEEKIKLIRDNQKIQDQVNSLNEHHSKNNLENKNLIEKLQQEVYDKEQSRKTTLSQKKSSEVRLGNIAEKLAPFLEDFPYDPEDAIFAGKPIDYIVFDDAAIVFVEIKSGKSQLSSKQRHIRDLIKANCVEWKEIRIK